MVPTPAAEKQRTGLARVLEFLGDVRLESIAVGRSDHQPLGEVVIHDPFDES